MPEKVARCNACVAEAAREGVHAIRRSEEHVTESGFQRAQVDEDVDNLVV
jgi:hypothetical protein